MKAHQTILQIKHAAVTFGLSLLAASLYAGTQGSYVNNGNIHSPPLPIPQIDATNFVNNGTFYVLTLDNFEFSNTENYTNRSVLTATGFRFDTAPSAAATTGINARHRAKTFLNGTLTTPISSYNSAISASGLISVNASNVVNRGIMSVGSAGQVHIEGNNLDLQRGFLQTSGMGSQQGMAMDYWANANAANAKFNPAQDFNTNNPTAGVASHGTNAATPYQYYTPGDFTWGRGGGEIFARQFVNARKISGTNAQVSVNAVFVRVADTNNATVKIVGEQKGFNDVTPGDLGVELAVVATNAFGTAVTNYFSVLDTMGLFRTNKFKKFPPGTNVTTAIAYGGLFYRPVYFSTNYTIERAPLTLFGTDGTPIQRYLDDTNFVPFSQTNSVVLGTNNLAITNVISVVTNILPFLVGTNGIISGNTNFFVVDTMYFGTNSATRTNRLVPGNRNFNVTSFATVNGTNQSVTIRNDLEIVSDGDVSFFITNTFSRGSEITNTFMTIAPYFNITNVFAGTNVVISNFVCTAAGLTLDNTTYRPNPPASISNLVGSVDISAEQSLNLNYSRISAVNYVKIEALSGFKGSSNAIISTPFCDVRLAATNGSLVVSNLLASAPPTLVGTVDIYSVFWTNQVVNIPSLNTNASPVETTSRLPMAAAPGVAPASAQAVAQAVVRAAAPTLAVPAMPILPPSPLMIPTTLRIHSLLTPIISVSGIMAI
jgi:hypothetical protein